MLAPQAAAFLPFSSQLRLAKESMIPLGASRGLPSCSPAAYGKRNKASVRGGSTWDAVTLHFCCIAHELLVWGLSGVSTFMRLHSPEHETATTAPQGLSLAEFSRESEEGEG